MFEWVARPLPPLNPTWAVVQDLRPFRYDIWSQHRTLRSARRAAAKISLLKVERLDHVLEENRRLAEDSDYFWTVFDGCTQLDVLYGDTWRTMSRTADGSDARRASGPVRTPVSHRP